MGEKKVGTMNITVFNGSPWGKEGHTNIMAEEFLLEACQRGIKVSNIQLMEKNINVCIGCGVCFYKTPGKCMFDDDMAGLISKFITSDIVVFTTPVYIDNVTSLMKIFIDRLTPVLEPHYVKDSLGQYRRKLRFRKSPKFIVISSCAMPEQSQFQVLSLFFKRMARTMHTEVVGEIYLPCSGILVLAREEIKFKPLVEKYKKLLRLAGEDIIKTGTISKEVTEKLKVPLIDADEYVEYANKLWDQLLPKHSLLKVPVNAFGKKLSKEKVLELMRVNTK